jgi:AhpD family alkylhydroperoxidase
MSFPFKTNIDVLSEHSEPIGQAFQSLRRAIQQAGPIDEKTRELILLAVFAATQIKSGLMIHCRIAKLRGVSREQCEHAVLLGFSSSHNAGDTSRAIELIRRVWRENSV